VTTETTLSVLIETQIKTDDGTLGFGALVAVESLVPARRSARRPAAR